MNEGSKDLYSYSLLERLLSEKGLPLKGIYDNHGAAAIFGVSTRTIQDWVRQKKLNSRELPGRGRFLSEDFEALLRSTMQRGGER